MNLSRLFALAARFPLKTLVLSVLLWFGMGAATADGNHKSSHSEPQAQSTPGTKAQDAGKSPDYSIRVNVPVVALDVSVTTSDGLFVPGLTRENFKVFEDGVPQTIDSFELTQQPTRVVLLVEFSTEISELQYRALRASSIFVDSLRKDDWVALMLYDRNTHIQQDFTQNKAEFYASMNSIGIPLSSEVCTVDALYDTVDRLQGLQGRKYIVLIGTGRDTFSKKTFDQVLNKLQFAQDTIIYSLDSAHGLPGHLARDNMMQAFAKLSGGKLYFVFSPHDYADAFSDLDRTLRNRYLLSYHSTHNKQDGSWHKIKLEIVPSEAVKKDRYQITVREGYRSKKDMK
jgi:VWFA-related protein